MEADLDFEALGLLDGLEGEAREERAELIAWLLERGFDIEHIRASVAAPLMLPAYRVLGDDGTLLSAREICESTGIDLELLQRLQRAIGLPRIDYPDAAVLPRADAEAVRHVTFFLELGYHPDDAVAVMRVLVESLGHAAAMMREVALKTLLRPGATEIELAQASEQLAIRAAPKIGPLMDDLTRLELRHSFEQEAVTAAERAAGRVPGARAVTVAFADVAGFTRLARRGDATRGVGTPGQPAGRTCPRRRDGSGPVRQIDWRRGDAGFFRGRPAVVGGAGPGRRSGRK